MCIDSLNTNCESNPSNYPSVTLEYPTIGAMERFPLVAPKSSADYDPIVDVVKSLVVITENYLTQDQQALLGSWSQTIDRHSEDGPGPNYLLNLERARCAQDGLAFMKTFSTITGILSHLKSLPQNPFSQSISSWTSIPRAVVIRIVDETWYRAVNLQAAELSKYTPFSQSVYGELTPSLLHRIFCLTGLSESSLFLDVGSGVGNAVCQASLQTGCRSHGIELNPRPAKIAQSFLANFRARCQMWGVTAGDIDLEEGDALLSPRVHELIAVADVLLINNKAFGNELNGKLREKLGRLKDGARVISLEPFVHGRVIADMLPWCITEHIYDVGGNSWNNRPGPFYIGRVDRVEHALLVQRLASESE
ncbi:S-adenosyl-L-methionine-dependent methyltransferase [Mycena sp. CBHHK59/15]|nr:S-adenosyl-L-methionine-dependent methyltransferase [Mycena sp. CBHHK59/15]